MAHAASAPSGFPHRGSSKFTATSLCWLLARRERQGPAALTGQKRTRSEAAYRHRDQPPPTGSRKFTCCRWSPVSPALVFGPDPSHSLDGAVIQRRSMTHSPIRQRECCRIIRITVSEQSLPEADTDSAEARSRADIAPVPTGLSAIARRHTARRSSSQSVAGPGKPDHMVRNSASASRPVRIVDRIGAAGRSHAFLAPARLEAFIAAAEEGTFSAAARRLDVSQPALSQAVTALERQLSVQLLVRSSTGVRTTEAGVTLLAEARAILVRHDQMVRTVTAAPPTPPVSSNWASPVNWPAICFAWSPDSPPSTRAHA